MTGSNGVLEELAVGIDKAAAIGALEQKIKQCEKSLNEQKSSLMFGWMPLMVSIGIVIFSAVKITWHYAYLLMVLFGLLYSVFNVWRLYRANQRRLKFDTALKQYQDQKAALQASMTGKE